MAKITQENMNQFNSTRLTIAGVIAVLPFTVGPLSIFGIHDFIIKRYKQGIAHVIISLISYLPLLMYNLLFQNSNNYDLNLSFILSLLAYIPIISSYIWSLVEGVQILQCAGKSKQEPVVNNMEASSIAPANQSKSAPEEAQKQLNTTQEGNELKNQKKYGYRAIISLVATIIPILLFTYCFITSGGSMSENGPGAIWWLMIMYYWSIGVPLLAVAIAFGILGLRTNLRWVAILSLSLKALTLIFVVLLFSGVFSR